MLEQDGISQPAETSGEFSPDAPAVPDATTQPAVENSDFDPQQYGYLFRGDMVYPKDRNHLTELMQLGHSYNHNRQKWQDYEQQLNTQRQQYGEYAKLHEALQQHPELAEQIRNAYAQYTTGQQQTNVQQDADPRYLELQSKIDQLTQFQEATLAQQADAELQREMSDLEKKYPNHDWGKDTGDGTLRQQLLNFMHSKGITDPELAYRAFIFPQAIQQTKLQAGEKTTKQIQSQHRQGVVHGATRPGPPPSQPKNIRNQSYESLAEEAIAELNKG